MRLDRYICECSAFSRSEVKKYIKAGHVKVNDVRIKDSSFKVDEEKDMVSIDGKELIYSRFHYFMLNKPAGVISAVKDEHEKTVIDIFKDEGIKNLFPVGRLDKDTEGLLIITDDGALAHELLSPAKHVEKTYYVISDKALDEEHMKRIEEGVDIGEEKLTLPAKIKKDETDPSKYSYLLTITQGRFHQVKRMFEAVGAKVLYLKRISMGELALDDKLASGEYRSLTEQDLLLLSNRDDVQSGKKQC